MPHNNNVPDEEKIAKARRQLLIVGVVCVAAIVALLWILSLRGTFERNRNRYQSAEPLIETIQMKATEFKEQLKSVNNNN